MKFEPRNILRDSGGTAGSEDVVNLFQSAGARIERIVSRSYSSAPGRWYDQAEDEWVMVVLGTAALEFDGGEIVEMKEGDYMLIPRHARHRVARTDGKTIWLAVHVQ